MSTQPDGWCNSYDDGDVASTYVIKGILKNLPSDLEDNKLNVSIYEENGKFIKESDRHPIKSVEKSSEKSRLSTLGIVVIYDFKNVSNIELKLYGDEGNTVFAENTTFDMDDMDIHYVTKSSGNKDSGDQWIDSYFDKVSMSGLDKDN